MAEGSTNPALSSNCKHVLTDGLSRRAPHRPQLHEDEGHRAGDVHEDDDHGLLDRPDLGARYAAFVAARPRRRRRAIRHRHGGRVRDPGRGVRNWDLVIR